MQPPAGHNADKHSQGRPSSHAHVHFNPTQPTQPTQSISTHRAAFRAAGELGGKVIAESAKPGTLAGMALDIFAGAYGAEEGVAGACVGVYY